MQASEPLSLLTFCCCFYLFACLFRLFALFSDGILPETRAMAETSKGVNAGKLASNVQKRIIRAQEKVREYKTHQTPVVLINVVLSYSPFCGGSGDKILILLLF